MTHCDYIDCSADEECRGRFYTRAECRAVADPEGRGIQMMDGSGCPEGQFSSGKHWVHLKQTCEHITVQV